MSDVSLESMLSRAGRDPAPRPVTPAPARAVFVHTFGCQMNEADSARMTELLGRHGFAAVPHPEEADLILYNGKIVTMWANHPTVEAVAIRGGRFLAVGSDDDVRVFSGHGPATTLGDERRVVANRADQMGGPHPGA